MHSPERRTVFRLQRSGEPSAHTDGPTLALLILAGVAISLVALGVTPSDVQVIVAELAGVFTGYAMRRPGG
jgi:hypothetical protein